MRLAARHRTLHATRSIALGFFLLGAAARPAAAQEPEAVAASPEALADAFLHVFATGARSGGEWQLLPVDARAWIEEASKDSSGTLVPGLGRVVHREGDRATLVLSGILDSADGTAVETVQTLDLSGFYDAERTSGGWHVGGAHPLDAHNSIAAQDLDVRIRPGRGLDVEDTLTVEVGDPAGFAVRLNHAVELETVRLDGQPAEHAFGGGLLWVAAQPGEHRLELGYIVDVARDSTADPNSGRFAADYGHVRNQYFWHPFFDFQSEAQNADFTIRVRAPEEFLVATDLSQTETVENGTRTVVAQGREPTFALSLFYDRAWKPTRREVQGYRLERFATPGTPPSADSLAAAFRRSYSVLAERFGAPSGGYLAVVQSRAREGRGWMFRSNDAIAVPAGGGGRISSDGARPRATFGHEVAHGWTRPTGPAANFLREGWATFAESILLEDEYGPEVVGRFWENERVMYFAGPDGRMSILVDPGNRGVAYSKGSWILRMLRDFVGPDGFRRGFARYMEIPAGEPAGHEEFSAAMSEASGKDVAPSSAPGSRSARCRRWRPPSRVAVWCSARSDRSTGFRWSSTSTHRAAPSNGPSC